MRMYDLICKKRNGQRLSSYEIDFLIDGFVRGEIPDYQMAALCMAIYFRGMDPDETVDLTMSMVNSGEAVDLKNLPGIKVDKHSTGGVGDKTTLVLAPLIAAAGVPVAKMSGRGLGHTGGTVDKLESIPGFEVELSIHRFLEQVRGIGIAIAAQTGNLVPADKKLYALRDVTATVDSIPLIASSVMSKKIASGADAILLDVKVGKGAFMKDLPQAKELAGVMVRIGQRMGRRTVAVLSTMDQPLGRAVGNSVEVVEAMETLKGRGPVDLTELCLKLGGQMLFLAGKVQNPLLGEEDLRSILDSGLALEKFCQLVEAQGGDVAAVDDYSRLPLSKYKVELTAETEGNILEIDAYKIGIAAMTAGAGRIKKGEPIDFGAGIELEKKSGEPVKQGDKLAVIYAATAEQAKAAQLLSQQAIKIGSADQIKHPDLVYEVVSGE